MSSKIEVQRICKHCGGAFIAKTTVTNCCSDRCAKGYWKTRQREAKIEASNKETIVRTTKPILEVQAKEFLTVKDLAALLNCSLHTVYRLIDAKKVKAVNLGERKTLVKRSEIDKLFN